jgi:hypothetical protein
MTTLTVAAALAFGGIAIAVLAILQSPSAPPVKRSIKPPASAAAKTSRDGKAGFGRR